MPPPISDPLIHASSLTYKGCFRLPTNGGRYDFPSKGMAYNPANDSLFVCSYADFHSVGEVSLATPILGAPSVNSLNRATVIQTIADPSNGSWQDLIYGAGIILGGVLPYNGRLIFTYYRFYDADGTQPFSHWARNNLSLTPPTNYVGPVTLQVTNLVDTTQPHAGNVSGYMATIPAAWQSAFGGPCMTGNCGISIVSRTSLGPCVFAFNPDNVGVVNPVPTQALVFYPGDHPTLGVYGNPAPNTAFNGTMQMGGVCFAENFRTVLFFGMIGIGKYAYGNGTPDITLDGQPVPDEPGRFYVYDPQQPTPGDHAYPYEAWVWAYDAAQLAQVVAGSLNPWDVVPYERWKLDSDFYSFLPRLSGAAYKASTQEIFVTQTFGDGDAPLVHVYQIAAATSGLYVSTTGSDSNPGTISQPFRHIAYGALQVTAGSTLWVRGGTYDETLSNINSGTSWSNTVRIAAYPNETVWLTPSNTDANANRVIWLDGNFHYIEFDGINCDGRPSNCDGVLWTSTNSGNNPHHIRFQNAECVIGNQGSGGARGGIFEMGAHVFLPGGTTGANELINLTIHGGGANTGGGGTFEDNSYGIYIISPSNLVDHCDVYDTAGIGIAIYSRGDAPSNNIIRNSRVHDIVRWNVSGQVQGILVTVGSNNQVYNNLIYGITQADTSSANAAITLNGNGQKLWYNTIYNMRNGVYIDGASSGTEVKNTIAYAITNTPLVNGGSGTIASNNMFSGVNPLFVNAAAANFHLTVNSPARGAGIGLLQVPNDFDGVPRPTSGSSDAGAYQFVTGTSTSGTVAVSNHGPAVASSGKTGGGGGPAAVAVKGPTINASGRSTLIGTSTVAVKGPTVNAGGGGTDVTGTAASAVKGPAIAASGVTTNKGVSAVAVHGPAVAASGGGANTSGTATLFIHGPAVASSGQPIASGYCLLGIAGPTVLSSWRPDNTGTSTVALAGPRVDGSGEGVEATGTATAAMAGPTVDSSGDANAGQATSATLGPTVAASGAGSTSGAAALSVAGPTVLSSGFGVGTTGTAAAAIAGPALTSFESPAPEIAVVTGLNGNCARNEVTITGLHFLPGATIVLTGYLGVVETFDLVSLTATTIVLNHLNPPLLSRTQYCVTVTNP